MRVLDIGLALYQSYGGCTESISEEMDDSLKPLQGFAHGDQRLIVGYCRYIQVIDRHSFKIPAMLFTVPASCPINQNTPHRLGRRSEKMPTILPGGLISAS
jgi:hypothetical protein